MIAPDVKFYARFVDTTGTKKTPKYTVVQQAGYYPQMESQRGKDGKISVYLMASKDSGSTKDNAPAMKLQGRNSLNLTGLKEYFVDGGKLSGFAYGYPLDKPTYSKDEKQNPFYDCKDDCYLFVMHQKDANTRPYEFEMVVLENAKALAPAYCKSLMMGGFNEVLASLRLVAK